AKIAPSAAAATTILAVRSSIRCQLRRPTHPLPKPPHRQTPITATAHTAARGFLPWRLSNAGPQHGWVARDGPASETLHKVRTTGGAAALPVSLQQRKWLPTGRPGRPIPVVDIPSSVLIRRSPILVRWGREAWRSSALGTVLQAHSACRGEGVK